MAGSMIEDQVISQKDSRYILTADALQELLDAEFPNQEESFAIRVRA